MIIITPPATYEYSTTDRITPEQLESRRKSAILSVSHGICIRITKALVRQNRALNADEIQGCIDEEESAMIADAERFPTCNNLHAFNYREEIVAMVRTVLPVYYPCPQEHLEHREATRENLLSIMPTDADA